MSNPEAKKYADEAAAERTARKKLEAELKKFQDAQAAAELAKLGDLEKAQKQLTDAQAAHATLATKYQRLLLEREVSKASAALGIADPALALAMVQAEHADQLVLDDDGTPKGLDQLLRQVLADHPLLAGAPATPGTQPPRPPASSGAAASPSRSTNPAPTQPEKRPLRTFDSVTWNR